MSKEVELCSFIGTLTYSLVASYIGCDVNWELVGDKLFLAVKIPIAGKGVCIIVIDIANPFNREDMSNMTELTFRQIEAAVLLADKESECKTTESSSSEN